MLALFLVGMQAALSVAHETDQYTLPVGREFADLGPYFSRMVYRAVEDAVADTNAAIQRALNTRPSARQIGELQSSDFIAGKVWLHLFGAFPTIESLDGSLASEKTRARYPGLIAAYRSEQGIYDDPLLMLDITKVVRTFFRACTVSANGTPFGTDKLIHFIHLGRILHSGYESRRKQGLSESGAIAATLSAIASNGLLSEGAFLGMFTTGMHSNADLAADYAGFKFYRNLTEPVRLGVRVKPPILVRDGPYWRVQAHPASDFFTAFITPHWNEALNPNKNAALLDARMRVLLRDRCGDVRDWYRDEQGQPLSRQQFETIEHELAMLYGEEYGYATKGSNRVSIATICFPVSATATTVGEPTEGAKPASAGQPLHSSPPSDAPGRVVGAADALGRSALWRAARAGYVEEVERLAAKGEDPNGFDHDSETPLHAAARTGRLEAVQVLVAHGADPDPPALYGTTPLMLAVQRGHADTARALLRAGANPNLRDMFGNSALHHAASNGSPELTDLLLIHGAAVSAATDAGNTPLHLAARGGNQAVATFLLAHGAADGARNASGATPSDLAKRNGHVQIAQSIKQAVALRSANPAPAPARFVRAAQPGAGGSGGGDAGSTRIDPPYATERTDASVHGEQSGAPGAVR
jgi:ankyrin repeat protein